MKVVIDTNVIVSGLLSPFGHSAEVLRLLSAGRIVICFDTRILLEYQTVLMRPRFGFSEHHIRILMQDIECIGITADAVPLKTSLPDPDDDKFLEVASAAEAECIITGNRRHFPKKVCGKMKIFTPAEFREYYR